MYVCMHICMGFMALITAMALCAESQDSLLSVSVSMVHAVFSTTGPKGGREPCLNTRETATLWTGIQKPRALRWDRTHAMTRKYSW